MGESELEPNGLVTAVRSALAEQAERATDLRVNTPRGRYQVRRGLDTILATAPQLPKSERWPALARYIAARIIDAKPKNHSQPALSPPDPLLIHAG